MTKKEGEKATILTKPRTQGQIPVDFAYLNYLCVSSATVLGYLQSPPLEEPEDEPQKSAAPVA